MKQVIYAMQFSGTAAGVTGSSSTLRATTIGSSCRLTTVAGPEGVHGNLQTVAGADAHFESEVTLTGETSFRESGTIRFGDVRNVLNFSTVGEGYLAGSADPRLKHGTVTWRVDGGEGQFSGATGLITSNFTIGGNGEVIDNHFGVIFLK
jgi:hypothetical protein